MAKQSNRRSHGRLTRPRKILKGNYHERITERQKLNPEYYRKGEIDIVHDLLWEKTRYYMLNTPGGVFLDRLGYFFIFMTPKKKILKYKKHIGGNFKKTKIDLLFNTGGYIFAPTFLPCNMNSVAKFWRMDYEFYIEFKREMVEKLNQGYRYINLTSVFDNRNKFSLKKNAKK